MAFPIPSHLPRRENRDVSTKLLTDISETTFKSLSQEVASKWVAELNVAIRQTKVRTLHPTSPLAFHTHALVVFERKRYINVFT